MMLMVGHGARALCLNFILFNKYKYNIAHTNKNQTPHTQTHRSEWARIHRLQGSPVRLLVICIALHIAWLITFRW